jgi:hypothetical protein
MRGCFSEKQSSCCRGGYKRGMKDKHIPDRSGELYQDAFTENESKPRGALRDEVEGDMHLDPDVDSQEADEALRENRFGLNQPKQKANAENP